MLQRWVLMIAMVSVVVVTGCTQELIVAAPESERSISVRWDGSSARLSEEAGAIDFASMLAGFRVRPPDYLPGYDWRLTAITVSGGVPGNGILNRPPSANTRVLMDYRTRRDNPSDISRIAIVQRGVHVEIPEHPDGEGGLGPSSAFETGLPAVTAARSATSRGAVYTVWIGDRTFNLQFRGAQPPESEMLKLILSLWP